MRLRITFFWSINIPNNISKLIDNQLERETQTHVRNCQLLDWKLSPVAFYHWIRLRNTTWLSFQANASVKPIEPVQFIDFQSWKSMSNIERAISCLIKSMLWRIHENIFIYYVLLVIISNFPISVPMSIVNINRTNSI